MPLARRREVLEEFAGTPGAVLLATDAAGEGLNLQDCCHVVVHYELPWNPNRLEQRNGRVDRYGQPHVVEISYLYLADTRDEEILQRLREKLAEITRQLGLQQRRARHRRPRRGDRRAPGGPDRPRSWKPGWSGLPQQVREYLATSGALMVLRGPPDEHQAEAETAASRERRPLAAARLRGVPRAGYLGGPAVPGPHRRRRGRASPSTPGRC